ncbi:hypothetical protein UF72_0680 [Staphylococcus equorum subsp. equorum]|uniref:hypothetical protein n=1 Tax=Staphylococcus equorum TaxID=246432 RepID=UPI000623C5D3|nr:hypothetical protein [Staphylococcus equorum]KKI55454.1 hypothetical protein UF72_0680 [Staphylococcus equorum subsp. equorum]
METDFSYIVEVNDGIYLRTAKKDESLFGRVYDFTKNIKNATKFTEIKFARKYAEVCGGKVRYYTVTHEVK